MKTKQDRAKRIAEIYVNEFHRDDGDFTLDIELIKEAIRLKEEDRVWRIEKWQEQQGL